jgi:lipoate-protein ligase A
MVCSPSTVPSISIGAFQDIDTEVDLDRARELGVQVIRRYGIGTMFVDPVGAWVWFSAGASYGRGLSSGR